MYKIITGMSKEYYNLIGNKMIESWILYWPKNFKLVIYTEDDLSFLSSDRIEVISLDTMDDEYKKFQTDDLSNFNSRIKIFAKKAWPIMKNLEENTGKLIWLDADVITISDITTEWLNSLLDDNSFSCHLGVSQGTYYSVETGFFIINLNNKFKSLFLKKYKSIYYLRDFKNMFKPFDGDTFGRVITEMKDINGFIFQDLSSTLEKLSPFNKVFKNKMKHYKANRKHKYGVDKNAN